ncbi:MAG: Hsp20/alpha crystallin family protein [Sphaerochaetaceae bacterium]|nr:Hsp20/alpha crystallin family protein [Sphaerochaetaceae bacterium]
MKYMVTRNNNNHVSDGFDGLFNDFFGDWGTSCRIPSVDVHENDKQYTLEAELPGYTQDDVKINVQKHVLTISSEKESHENEDKKYLVRERCYRSFERSFTLPEGVDEDHISADLENGVLKVALPKLPVEQPKKIEVKIGK